MRGLVLVVVLTAAVVLLGAAHRAPAATTSLFDNCTALHSKYPHGVGRANARDRVRGHTAPVTTFVRDTALYRKAIRYNDDLDRDRDGVACEKR